jgi:hypothetical protein
MIRDDLTREKLHWIIENVDEMIDFEIENETENDTY